MIKVENCGIILESREGVSFESEGVLNPACVEKDGIMHMFYRAVGKGNFSTIGYCQIKDDKIINRLDKPLLIPEFDYEREGMEDPRITYLDGKYYMLYTAYDGKSALVAYAISNDLKTWEKKGLVTPQISYDEAEDIFRNSGIIKKYTFFEKTFRQMIGDTVFLWEKDTMLFPKNFNGKHALIHRILPGIQICYFDDFDQLTPDFWREYLKKLGNWIIMDPKYQFENGYIGGGCVPIEIDEGWLLIYHSTEETISEGRIYRASAALLDKDNPKKVIGRLPYPLFEPKEEWEKQGVIDNVVFPTGTRVKDGELYIYYGAGDRRIGYKKIEMKELINNLKDNSE